MPLTNRAATFTTGLRSVALWWTGMWVRHLWQQELHLSFLDQTRLAEEREVQLDQNTTFLFEFWRNEGEDYNSIYFILYSHLLILKEWRDGSEFRTPPTLQIEITTYSKSSAQAWGSPKKWVSTC